MEIKVINLDSRSDRWEEVQKELNGKVESYQRFSAISGGMHKGCLLSHIEVMKGKGPILVFEDDIMLEPDFLRNFADCLFELPKDFDLFYLGANVKEKAERYSEHLWRVIGGVHCTYALLYSAEGRRKFNEHTQEMIETQHIDQWFYYTGLKILKAYVCNPLLAFQRPGYSDVRLATLDYREEMIENAKKNMQ